MNSYTAIPSQKARELAEHSLEQIRAKREKLKTEFIEEKYQSLSRRVFNRRQTREDFFAEFNPLNLNVSDRIWFIDISCAYGEIECRLDGIIALCELSPGGVILVSREDAVALGVSE